MSASAKANSLYDACRPRLFRSATCTAASAVRLRRRRPCTMPFARSASSSVRIDATSLLMVSAATLATTVMPPSGENVAHPDRRSAESKTILHERLDRSRLGTAPKVLYIARSYRSDFGAGAARSFCSRQDDGAVGRWLV